MYKGLTFLPYIKHFIRYEMFETFLPKRTLLDTTVLSTFISYVGTGLSPNVIISLPILYMPIDFI